MPRFSDRSLAALLLVAALAPPIGTRLDTAASDFVLVREGDVVTEDLYAAAQRRVIVRGVVEGDLVATAFEDVVVEGTVEGDVLAVAPTVRIDGEVGGSVRVIGGRLELSGSVADDVAAAAAFVDIGGTVGRDALLFGWSSDLSGDVGRHARMTLGGALRMSGVVAGDVEVNADSSIIAGRVDGDVRHRGSIAIDESGSVGGLQAPLGSLPVPIRVRALLLASSVLAAIGLLLYGLAAIRIAPDAIRASAEAAIRPWSSLAVGIGAWLLPVGAVVAWVAALGGVSADLVVPALVSIAPLAIAYLAAIGFASVLGVVPMSTLVGRVVGPDRSVAAHFVAGIAIWLIVALVVPYSLVIVAVGLMAGTGAIVRAALAGVRPSAGGSLPEGKGGDLRATMSAEKE